MALREIRQQGDPILLKECRPVKELKERDQILIDDMIETMHYNEGVGLAAPQVGVLKQIAVVDVSEDKDDPIVLINPKVIETDGEQTGPEGCLSVPNLYGDVTRPNFVVVEALDRNMEVFTIEGEELFARAMCHEIDHLSGHMYTELAEGPLYEMEEEEQKKRQSKKQKRSGRRRR